MRISDWSSDVCSSDLRWLAAHIEFRYQFAVYGNAAGLGFEAGVLANRFKDFIEREDLGRQRRFAMFETGDPQQLRDHVFELVGLQFNAVDRKSTSLNPSH